jgi:hypothetical protein
MNYPVWLAVRRYTTKTGGIYKSFAMYNIKAVYYTIIFLKCPAMKEVN